LINITTAIFFMDINPGEQVIRCFLIFDFHNYFAPFFFQKTDGL
jgi:hypothetical protein